MKKKTLVGILAMALMVIFAASAMAEVNIITGYAKNEFAVKGEIEKQLRAVIVKIAANQEIGQALNIAVIGSADKDGKSKENDYLAKTRAEEIAAVLSFEFPNANISIWSTGDVNDLRQVKVEHEFILPAPTDKNVTKQTLKENSKVSSVLLTIGIIAIFTLVLLVLVSTLMKKKKYQQTADTPKKDNTEHVTGEFEGKKYQVAITHKNNNWLSPFTQPSGAKISGPLGKVKSETTRKFKLAAKPGETGEFYRNRINELISKKIITPMA